MFKCATMMRRLKEGCAGQKWMARVVRRFCSVFRGVGAVECRSSMIVRTYLTGKDVTGTEICVDPGRKSRRLYGCTDTEVRVVT
jgi:hypothetical protein